VAQGAKAGWHHANAQRSELRLGSMPLRRCPSPWRRGPEEQDREQSSTDIGHPVFVAVGTGLCPCRPKKDFLQEYLDYGIPYGPSTGFVVPHHAVQLA
jgi:hypothetical protein